MSERVVLSERARRAIERFAKLAETAELETRGERRVDATKRYTASREALAPREVAILDMTTLKRRTLTDLAVVTNKPRRRSGSCSSKPENVWPIISRCRI